MGYPMWFRSWTMISSIDLFERPSRSPTPPSPKSGISPTEREQAAADLRAVLTEVFLHEEPAQRLLAISALVPAAHRSAWHLLTHTLLARRLALGSPSHLLLAADAHTLAWAWARQWEHPVLLQRWHRFIQVITARQCSQLASRAARHLRQLAALH
ncbi:MAG: hypothetical protein EBS47_02730 [Betaproteobacteria bacterium]|nr:hypothetical protein [Betaproteobacteria bacterium]NBT09617.1 hypothetical protein [Betaproteobacteria bacterium]NBU49013.1 hypothetical protein [Betaproteobacteria bacterium]NBX96183.1 hypothetical protein [Betaproteobacteria bacterium]